MSKAQTMESIKHSDVADYFLALANESGDVVTNLKLQKLVYYAQAWHLGIFSKRLFSADFEAWVHGPVIPALYHTYKERGSAPIVIKLKTSDVAARFHPAAVKFLGDVADVYMKFGGHELELMTHQEEPWVEARQGLEPDEPCSVVISEKTMERYYGQKAKTQD